MYLFVVFIHILSAFALAAGNVAALAATMSARRTSSPQTILTLMKLHHKAVITLIIPGSLVVLLSGLYLTQAMEVSFVTPWIAASLVAWLIAFLLGIVILVPAETKAIREAKALVEKGAAESSAALRYHVGALKIVLGEWIQQVLIIVFLYLMIFKPS